MAFRPDSAIFTIPLANSVSVKGQSGLDAGFAAAEVGLSEPEVIAVTESQNSRGWKGPLWVI